MCAVWLYYPLVGALLCNYVARIARLATTVLPSPPLASVASFFKTGCKVAFVLEACGNARFASFIITTRVRRPKD